MGVITTDLGRGITEGIFDDRLQCIYTACLSGRHENVSIKLKIQILFLHFRSNKLILESILLFLPIFLASDLITDCSISFPFFTLWLMLMLIRTDAKISAEMKNERQKQDQNIASEMENQKLDFQHNGSIFMSPAETSIINALKEKIRGREMKEKRNRLDYHQHHQDHHHPTTSQQGGREEGND